MPQPPWNVRARSPVPTPQMATPADDTHLRSSAPAPGARAARLSPGARTSPAAPGGNPRENSRNTAPGQQCRKELAFLEGLPTRPQVTSLI